MSVQGNVDRESATPIYLQVAALIRERIKSDPIPPNRRIPSESEIQERYGVTRATARKAVAVLRAEGLVKTVKGRGSYVMPIRPEGDSASEEE